MSILKSISVSSYLTIIALFFCLHLLPGQQNIYVMHELGSKQGLTDNRYNYYIHQDTEGLVWISSIAGLNRFDGRHVKNYLPNPDDPHAIRSVYVSSSHFYDDSKGNIWFTEDEAVIKYNRQDDNFEKYYATSIDSTLLQLGYIWAYLDQSSGLFWFGITDNGKDYLYTCDTRQENHPIVPVAQLSVSIKDKMIRTSDGKNRLFSILDKKLNIYTFEQNNLIAKEPIAIPEGVIPYSILPIDESSCWVASSHGLYFLDISEQRWESHNGHYQETPVNDIHEIAQWKSGSLVLATGNNGIYFYNPATKKYTGKILRYHNNKIAPFHPTVERIYIDSTDNLWVSTSDAGVFYTNLRKPKFKLELTGKAAITMTGRQHTPIILGLENIFYLQDGKWATVSLPTESGSLVKGKCLLLDSYNRLWLGTKSALYVKEAEDNTFKRFDQFPDNLTPQHITSITALPDQSILIGNVKQSPIRIQLDDLSVSAFSPTTKKGTNFIHYSDNYIFTDDENNLLKIYRYSHPTYVEDTSFTSLSIVNHITKDSTRNCYWMATDNGLYQLSHNTTLGWKLVVKSNLEENVISSLLVDGNGKLWMGTPRGLVTYQPNTGEQHLYNDSDLLQDYHFYRTSAWKAQDGTFYFGGVNGVNHFNPLHIRSKIADAHPLVVDILINQHPGIAHEFSSCKARNPHLIKALTLPFQKNNLTIHLGAGEYSDPEECYFISELTTSNNTVRETQQNRILRFSNLSPGTYNLKIWAVNADGIKSPEAHQLELIIRPPLHRSKGAIALYLALLYLLYRYRLKQITVQQQLKQEITKAELLAAETENAVLRLQMNPHFIFNSLVAIKSLVNKKDQKAALTFLSRFSKLMRKILNESSKQLNSLDEEKELLENYLALEQLRFPDKMTYGFYIDPTLDTYDTLLPTMILQPFVENAIVHGIRNKPTSGHIQINFLAADDDYLRCEVRDNGIGRGAQPSNSSHESKATKITARRLEVITTSMKLVSTPSFEIIDELNDKGEPAGTSVSFLFPPFY